MLFFTSTSYAELVQILWPFDRTFVCCSFPLTDLNFKTQDENLCYGHKFLILPGSFLAELVKILRPCDSNLRLLVFSFNRLELLNAGRGTLLWTQLLDEEVSLPGL
jgi:hypothetical protein